MRCPRVCQLYEKAPEHAAWGFLFGVGFGVGFFIFRLFPYRVDIYH